MGEVAPSGPKVAEPCRTAGRTRCVSGIDVGGTFTDIVVHETGQDGARVRIGKVPTTLPNQTDGVLAAIAEAGRGTTAWGTAANIVQVYQDMASFF